MVALIILAAGASTRLGQPKQLLSYRGQSLLQRAVETASDSVCDPVVLVLGAGAERLQREAMPYPVQIVVNRQWQTGMASSLQCGVQALEDSGLELEGVVVSLCDQPLLSAAIINGVVQAFHRAASPIVASSYGGTLGVPALFSRSIWDELKALDGHEGARKIIQRDHSRLHQVPFAGGEIDIDTLEDYERLQGFSAQVPSHGGD